MALCPQKEVTRRVRLTPRVRAPASIPAESEDSAEEDDEDTDNSVSFQPYIEAPRFLVQEHQPLRHSEAGDQVKVSPARDSSDGSWASTVNSSLWDEAGSSGYLAKKEPGQRLSRDGCEEPLPVPEFSKDSSSLEEPPKDDLSSWANWGSSSPTLNLAPREPLVSLQTLTFCWDSSPEEGEEEEEEAKEEEEGERDSEIEDSGTSIWGADSLLRTEARGRTLGHYMAR